MQKAQYCPVPVLRLEQRVYGSRQEASERGCDQRSHSDEVTELKKENARLKEMVADLVLRYDIVKKSLDMLD